MPNLQAKTPTMTQIAENNIDKRTKNGKPLDIKQVLHLKKVNKLTNAQISSLIGYSPQYISKVLKDFKDLLVDPRILDTYDHNRKDILDGIELKLLDDLVDEDKRQKASLNNVAYAMTQVSQLRRLESGQSTSNIGISIEAKLAKALDKAHKTEDTINNKVQDWSIQLSLHVNS